ncbi:hypothetical protein D3C84_1253780 [compost metagenome]
MAQRTEEHGAGVVVLQPLRVASEHAALLDRIAELEKAVIADFQHADQTELVLHLGQYPLFTQITHSTNP